MRAISFGDIEKFILLGGGKFMVYVARRLQTEGFKVVVFTAVRHLNEVIDGKTLRALLEENSIIYHESEDINKDAMVSDYISDKTISLSFGAAWIFKKDFIDKFHGKLINFHGTRLPQNRGAGGFSWQILRQNKLGFCLMHQVDYGVDTGDIIKYREFLYPHSCKVPADFMEYHIKENISFFEEFLIEIKSKKNFECISQPEYLSIYWPRLNTLKHAFIDWSWGLKDIENFINAFDEPYAGGSTFLNNKRVFLKECYSDYNDGQFHPFQSGMVYRKSNKAIFIAAKEGTLILKKVMDEANNNIINDIRIGDRFFTPSKYLEDAKLFRATYTPSGLKEG